MTNSGTSVPAYAAWVRWPDWLTTRIGWRLWQAHRSTRWHLHGDCPNIDKRWRPPTCHDLEVDVRVLGKLCARCRHAFRFVWGDVTHAPPAEPTRLLQFDVLAAGSTAPHWASESPGSGYRTRRSTPAAQLAVALVTATSVGDHPPDRRWTVAVDEDVCDAAMREARWTSYRDPITDGSGQPVVGDRLAATAQVVNTLAAESWQRALGSDLVDTAVALTG